MKENINQYIQNPASIQKEDLDAIRQLSERYPYSSTLSILLLEGYHQFDFVAYEKSLSQTAILAPDRERLHGILEYQNETQELDESSESLESQNETQQPDLISNEGVPEEEEQEESKEIPEKDIQPTPTIEEGVKEEGEEVEVDASKEKDDEKEKELDHFEKELIASAINSSILSEVDDEEDEIQYKPNLKNKEADLEEEVQDQEEVDLDDSSEQKPESFIAFLRKINAQKETASDHKETDSIQDKPQSKHSDKASSDMEVIEKFIKNPNQKKTKKSFFSPTESAKKSLEENIDNVSETLAKIHELQGNYGKAIQAYEKLILKFPEKKSFFANRIEELKKK